MYHFCCSKVPKRFIPWHTILPTKYLSSYIKIRNKTFRICSYISVKIEMGRKSFYGFSRLSYLITSKHLSDILLYISYTKYIRLHFSFFENCLELPHSSSILVHIFRRRYISMGKRRHISFLQT